MIIHAIITIVCMLRERLTLRSAHLPLDALMRNTTNAARARVLNRNTAANMLATVETDRKTHWRELYICKNFYGAPPVYARYVF